MSALDCFNGWRLELTKKKKSHKKGSVQSGEEKVECGAAAAALELSVTEKCVRNVSESLSGVGRRFCYLLLEQRTVGAREGGERHLKKSGS